MTLVSEILKTVEENPGKSATQISRLMGKRDKLANISGELCRQAKKEVLYRRVVEGAWRYWLYANRPKSLEEIEVEESRRLEDIRAVKSI